MYSISNKILRSRGLDIYTHRLLIREYREADLAGIDDYAADPQVSQYLGRSPNEPEETKDFLNEAIAQQADQPRFTYELCLSLGQNQEVIGGIGLYLDAEEPKRAKIGYIIHPRHQ